MGIYPIHLKSSRDVEILIHRRDAAAFHQAMSASIWRLGPDSRGFSKTIEWDLAHVSLVLPPLSHITPPFRHSLPFLLVDPLLARRCPPATYHDAVYHLPSNIDFGLEASQPTLSSDHPSRLNPAILLACSLLL